nr:biotin transporter BioY [Actinomycetales bacterium]
PFTPVPLTLSTLGVIVTGAALGPGRGIAVMALYLAVGALGGPVFAGWESGWAFASFGYVLGYLPAAAIMGWGARRGRDRNVGTMALAALLASAAIYAVGLAWLVMWVPVGFVGGLQLGVLPFLVGDALKIGLAALLLPGAWRLVERLGR